jgi:hypothetical protein
MTMRNLVTLTIATTLFSSSASQAHELGDFNGFAPFAAVAETRPALPPRCSDKVVDESRHRINMDVALAKLPVEPCWMNTGTGMYTCVRNIGCSRPDNSKHCFSAAKESVNYEPRKLRTRNHTRATCCRYSGRGWQVSAPIAHSFIAKYNAEFRVKRTA